MGGLETLIPTVIAPCSGGGGKLTIALSTISIDFGTLAEDDGICSATKNVVSFLAVTHLRGLHDYELLKATKRSKVL